MSEGELPENFCCFLHRFKKKGKKNCLEGKKTLTNPVLQCWNYVQKIVNKDSFTSLMAFMIFCLFGKDKKSHAAYGVATLATCK